MEGDAGLEMHFSTTSFRGNNTVATPLRSFGGIIQEWDVTLPPNGSIEFAQYSLRGNLHGDGRGTGEIRCNSDCFLKAIDTSSIAVPITVDQTALTAQTVSRLIEVSDFSNLERNVSGLIEVSAGSTLTIADPSTATIHRAGETQDFPMFSDGVFTGLVLLENGANMVFEAESDLVEVGLGAAVIIEGSGNFHKVTEASGNLLIAGLLRLFNVPEATYANDLLVSGRLNIEEPPGSFGGTTVRVMNDLKLFDSGLFGSVALKVSQDSSLHVGNRFEIGESTAMIDGVVHSGSVDISKGGSLCGDGTINGQKIANGGRVKPGGSPGALTLNGDYTQTPTGVLEIELGGLQAGSEYDQLVVNGSATFEAGTEIAVTLIDPNPSDCLEQLFVPQAGDTFDFLSAEQLIFDGEFSDLVRFTNVPLGLNLGFELSFPGNMVALEVTEVTGTPTLVFGNGFEGDGCVP